MQFRGFEYFFNEQERRIKITSLVNPSIPKFVGKFISIPTPNNNQKNLDRKIHSLINGKIYATEIERLNDISEGLQFHALAEGFLCNFPNETRGHKQQFVDMLQMHFGIISFTVSLYSLPMWGLYTDNSGVFIEYSTSLFTESLYKNSKFSISNLFPIRYEEKYEEFVQALYSFQYPHWRDKTFIALHTKFSEWKFENEHRILVFNNLNGFQEQFKTCLRKGVVERTEGTLDRLLDFDVKSIRRIVLGFNFFLRVNEISKRDNNIVIFETTKESLGADRIALLLFCIENKIPVFKLDMTIYEPLTLSLKIEDHVDRFVFEYSQFAYFTNKKDY